MEVIWVIVPNLIYIHPQFLFLSLTNLAPEYIPSKRDDYPNNSPTLQIIVILQYQNRDARLLLANHQIKEVDLNGICTPAIIKRTCMLPIGNWIRHLLDQEMY